MYRLDSKWNDENELLSLIILKKLEASDFQRGLQIKLSKEMSKITGLTYSSISAKVSNYKSVAKINNQSNASKNTKRIYSKYKDYSVKELEEIINKT